MVDTAGLIRLRFDALDPVLDEQARRRFAAAEARAFGRGGVTLVSKVTSIARSTINRGIVEIEENRSAGAGRVRRPGGGRRTKTQEDPTLLDDLQSLLEASTRGDPMSPLLWTEWRSCDAGIHVRSPCLQYGRTRRSGVRRCGRVWGQMRTRRLSRAKATFQLIEITK